MNVDDNDLTPDELTRMTSGVVAGAHRLQHQRRLRTQLVTGGVAVLLVAGVAGVAFAAPLVQQPPILSPIETDEPTDSPSPTPTQSATPSDTPTPTPSASESVPPEDVEPETPAFTVADAQSSLDEIGPDVASTAQADYLANQDRGYRTNGLALEAAAGLGQPVVLIRPTYVGFPDESTDSPNSLLWWAVTSEDTQLPFSYTHTVNGQPWTGWGQGDRDLAALQARVASYFATTDPGRTWLIVTQSH